MFENNEEIGLIKKISLRVDENILNKKSVIPYPLPELRGLLISNKLNNEPIYLYLPEEQYSIFKYSLKIKDYHLINDKSNINKLIKDIGNYLDIFFKDYPLSSRINISYQEHMKKIKPSYSFILVPDEKFKIKYRVNDYHKNFPELKEHILTFDNKLKRVYSLKMISSLFSLDNSKKKIPILMKHHLHTYSNEEDLLDSSKKIFESKRTKKTYKNILRELFSSRLNDFRVDILNYCLDNTKYLREDNFENFVCFIEFFFLLFSGIKTKYYIDELLYLNMDFYADEKNIMNFAESFHYQVQFRIKDIPFIAPYGKKKKNSEQTSQEKKEIIQKKYETLYELNKEKNPPLDQERMEYYPTHCDFTRTISHGFRRYDLYDDYHICEKCKYIPNSESCQKLECSSCFRQIDKERLICLNLTHVINFNKMKELCEVPDDDKIFMDMIMHPNYEGINERINNKEIIINYLKPFETDEIIKLDKTFRDIYGENVGFYFVWVSHFIKWLFYLALIGLIMHILSFFITENWNKMFFLIINLIFIAFIVLWGNYYCISWDGQESFYNYIWGMNDYILVQNILYDFEEYLKLNVEIIMGVKIPIDKNFFYLLTNFCVFFISIFLHILMIISNILLIATKSYKFTFKNKTAENIFNISWEYIVPILCYLLREIFSYLGEKWDKWILNHVKQFSKDIKRRIKIRMKIVFEFFNYYFNLYYIAFIKKYYNTCLNGNCHAELGNQLTIIIICDLIMMIINVIIPAFHNIKKRKEIENNIKEIKTIDYEENHSHKYKYYTRNKFLYKNMKTYYIKTILYFGYIIQFGASAPLTFILILLLTILNRIMLAMSLKNIYFAQVFEESFGINKLKKWMKIISFIGILSNLCCIFYTNNYFYWLSNGRKLIYIALVENILLIIIKLFDYDSLPKWFYYKDKIDFTYLRKFGIRAKRI